MMHDFLVANEEKLIAGCRKLVCAREGRGATPIQLENGIPIFLRQLILTLQSEKNKDYKSSAQISDNQSGVPKYTQIKIVAVQHATDLISMNYTLENVVHDYGDICQVIMSVANEQGQTFDVNEYRTLNRCLDNAIASAVTEFSYKKEILSFLANRSEIDRLSNGFAEHLREVLGTASLAYAALKSGGLTVSGSTGAILEKSINTMIELIESENFSSFPNERDIEALKAFSLCEFISEVVGEVKEKKVFENLILKVQQVNTKLAISGEREELKKVLGFLIEIAFDFAFQNEPVYLAAYSDGNYILIEVGECFDKFLIEGVEEIINELDIQSKNIDLETMSLEVANFIVFSNGGRLSVSPSDGLGTTVTIHLPRYELSN